MGSFRKILGLGLKSEKFEIEMGTGVTFENLWDSDLILKKNIDFLLSSGT